MEDDYATKVCPRFRRGSPPPYCRLRVITTHDLIHDLRPPASARVMPSFLVVNESSEDLHVICIKERNPGDFTLTQSSSSLAPSCARPD